MNSKENSQIRTTLQNILKHITRISIENLPEAHVIYDELNTAEDFFFQREWRNVSETLKIIRNFLAKFNVSGIAADSCLERFKLIQQFIAKLMDYETRTEIAIMQGNILKPALGLFDFAAVSKTDRKESLTTFADDPEILQLFVDETQDSLDTFESIFQRLESNPKGYQLPPALFRDMHSIKGNAGVLGFHKIEKLTHIIESVLLGYRDAGSERNQIVDALFESLDTLKILIDYAAEKDTGVHVDTDPVFQKLEFLLENASAFPNENQEQPEPSIKNMTEDKSSPSASDLKVKLNKLDDLIDRSGELHLSWIKQKELLKEFLFIFNTIKKHRQILSDDINDLKHKFKQLPNEIGQNLRNIQDAEEQFLDVEEKILQTTDNVGHIVSGIQEGLLDIRMVPLNQLFNRLPRIVRDLSKKTGKTVHLNITGSEVRIDKRILEKMYDPLMHLIRNAVDHGIEPAEKRRQKNKPEEGEISIEAKRSGNKIIIEIKDDGGGFNLDQIKDRALKGALCTTDEIARWTEQDLIRLIFKPGFSTKAEVTNISGRGVGMDVVLENVNLLKGSVDVRPNPNGGCIFTIELPLSLAIDRVIYISVGLEKYAVFLRHIRETAVTSSGLLEQIENKYYFHKNESLVQVMTLDSIFQKEAAAKSYMPNILSLVLLKDRDLALGVDELLGIEEILTKPLPEEFSDLNYFSGLTINNAGNIVLILNLPYIAQTLT